MRNQVKTTGILIAMLFFFSISCKQNENDANQSAERPGYENQQQDNLNETMDDTTTVDTKMQGQSDTHGRDTDMGDTGNGSGTGTQDETGTGNN